MKKLLWNFQYLHTFLPFNLNQLPNDFPFFILLPPVLIVSFIFDIYVAVCWFYITYIGNILKLFQKQNLKIMSSFNLLIISIYVSSIIFPILRSAVPFVFMGFPVILSSSFSLMEGDFGLTSSGNLWSGQH